MVGSCCTSANEGRVAGGSSHFQNAVAMTRQGRGIQGGVDEGILGGSSKDTLGDPYPSPRRVFESIDEPIPRPISVGESTPRTGPGSMGRWSAPQDIAPLGVPPNDGLGRGAPLQRLKSGRASRAPHVGGHSAAYPPGEVVLADRLRVQITGLQPPISKMLSFEVDLI